MIGPKSPRLIKNLIHTHANDRYFNSQPLKYLVVIFCVQKNPSTVVLNKSALVTFVSLPMRHDSQARKLQNTCGRQVCKLCPSRWQRRKHLQRRLEDFRKMPHGNSGDACACVCQKSFGGTRHSEATRMRLVLLTAKPLLGRRSVAAKHIETDHLNRVASSETHQ